MDKPGPGGWAVLRRLSSEFEAELIGARLRAEGLRAVVLSQWDRSFGLLLGERAWVYVLVPPEDLERAEAMLARGEGGA
nr:MAG: hypothetical protein KatS3mg041_0463 [Bacteroidota bacterium]